MVRLLSARILTAASLVFLLSVLPTSLTPTLDAQVRPGAPGVPPPAPLAPCPPNCPPGGDDPPIVEVSPPGGSYGSPQQLSVSIEWCEDTGLDANTREIIFNSQDVTASFSYFSPGFSEPCAGMQEIMRSQGTVTLQTGDNFFSAEICDIGGQCTKEDVEWGC